MTNSTIKENLLLIEVYYQVKHLLVQN